MQAGAERARGVGEPMDVDAGAAEEEARAVYESLPDEVKPGVMVRLNLVEEKLRSESKRVESYIAVSIVRAYPGIGDETCEDAIDAATAKLTALQASKSAPDASDASDTSNEELAARLALAFQTLYAGSAHVEFQEYLIRCWRNHKSNPLKFPYVAVMQSSGFGKSRLLLEFAKMNSHAESHAKHSKEVDIRVLYVCARNVERSTGFPAVTPQLKSWFFGAADKMADRLLATFTYAEAHWDQVGKQWLELFNTSGADAEVSSALELAAKNCTTASRSDENPCPVKRARVSSDTAADPKSGAPSSNGSKLLVVVIDEARFLIETKVSKAKDSTNYLRAFRRALQAANSKIEPARGRIFAVFVDTNSQIHDFVPPAALDPSARGVNDESLSELFPPFVLTHTMDALREDAKYEQPDGSFDYEAAAKQPDPVAAWHAVLSMGRPLWKCSLPDGGTVAHKQGVVLNFAATKLLLGAKVSDESSYSMTTLGGVAALLCRLGLRPRANSGLSSRMVADFMAVLGYVTYTYDAHVSNYPSEPVLAFGATRLWYELENSALATYMLPQFKELLRQGMMDTGNIGEIVARIILLLAMDEAVARAFPEHGDATKKATFRFVGQFCTAKQFLDQLGGEFPELRRTEGTELVHDDEEAAFKMWLEKWEGWKVGFSQFVELREVPTEKALWAMLGRRAAGMLPRNQDGADLVIPIFCGNAVSFVLIRVKNMHDADRYFPDTATTKLAPSKAFKPCHPISFTPPQDMIRVYMTLRECYVAPSSVPPPSGSRQSVRLATRSAKNAGEKPAVAPSTRQYRGPRYFLIDASDASAVSYSLVLRGMCRTPKRSPKLAELKPKLWPFLTKKVLKELEEIANAAWWDPMDQVRDNLSKRADSKSAGSPEEIMPATLLESAAREVLRFDFFKPPSAVPARNLASETQGAQSASEGDESTLEDEDVSSHEEEEEGSKQSKDLSEEVEHMEVGESQEDLSMSIDE